MTTRTAAVQKSAAKEAYDVFLSSCPSRQLFSTLTDKWLLLVLNALSGGAKRYSELNRLMAGVSPKMLTQTLRSMERDGLVTRSVEPTVPVTVAYQATDLGCSLFSVATQFKAWAETNFDSVSAARELYDSTGDSKRRDSGSPAVLSS
ncbi:helix-turn-helix domain-containing protein [Microbacterium sp. cx-59]|uniref:winged helix-turn-helix transcriptional regulator n=1 Tax=Microbacterium sp. cx-59 TaxID=2891207 RepID=UPI001E39E4E0|nr:helix-turn-helix domain-containing protein [Microbacterium sp. cx-59]MCC4907678.1 helix-turn-helix transcriptional regulator [Microbacterium sp. cx-59]